MTSPAADVDNGSEFGGGKIHRSFKGTVKKAQFLLIVAKSSQRGCGLGLYLQTFDCAVGLQHEQTYKLCEYYGTNVSANVNECGIFNSQSDYVVGKNGVFYDGTNADNISTEAVAHRANDNFNIALADHNVILKYDKENEKYFLCASKFFGPDTRTELFLEYGFMYWMEVLCNGGGRCRMDKLHYLQQQAFMKKYSTSSAFKAAVKDRTEDSSISQTFLLNYHQYMSKCTKLTVIRRITKKRKNAASKRMTALSTKATKVRKHHA